MKTRYIDTTPIVKQDIFVNDDFSIEGAINPDIGQYLEIDLESKESIKKKFKAISEESEKYPKTV